MKMSVIDTAVGRLIAVADEKALYVLEFEGGRHAERMGAAVVSGRTAVIDSIERELKLYCEGKLREFKTRVVMEGTPFQKQVWKELQKIPFGETRSYAEIASAIGRPTAFRAVAQANGANRLAIVVPCHRVIYADGSLGGYASGLEYKRALLKVER